MPNGAIGALESQQRIGAQIPYENIAIADRGVQAVIGAFQTGANLNARRRQLENQLLRMDLDAKFKEQKHDLDVTRMTMAAALQTAEYNRKLQSMDDAMTRAAWNIEARQNTLDYKQQRDSDRDQSLAAFAEGATRLPDVGDPKRESAIWDLISQNSFGANTPLGRAMAKAEFEKGNQYSRHAEQKWNSDYNAFLRDYKSTIGFGKSVDLNPLFHPEMWKPEYKDPQGGLVAPEDVARGLYPNAKPTGNVFIMYPPDPAVIGDKPHFVTYPKSFVNKKVAELNELYKRRDAIPPQVSNEFTTAYPAGRSAPQYNVGDRVTLKNGQTVTIKSINPDGTFSY